MDWLLAALRQDAARCGLRAACTCSYVLAQDPCVHTRELSALM